MGDVSFRKARYLTLAIAALGTACSATGGVGPPVYRGITIVDDHFYPASLVAPAGVPIVLELTRLNPGTLNVAIPSLGLPHLTVPGNLIIQNSTKSSPGAFAKLRQSLGELKPGHYEIRCLCATKAATDLTITGESKERAD